MLSKSPAVPNETTRLIALLESLGYDCTPRQRWVKELAISVATRMRSRVGADVFQTLAYSLSGFPKQAAIALFSGGVISTPKPTVTTWTATSVSELTSLMGTLLPQSGHLCSGLTRALKAPSESVIRVVATLMPLIEVSHVHTASSLDRLYVNTFYCLATEMGEVHRLRRAHHRRCRCRPCCQCHRAPRHD